MEKIFTILIGDCNSTNVGGYFGRFDVAENRAKAVSLITGSRELDQDEAVPNVVHLKAKPQEVYASVFGSLVVSSAIVEALSENALTGWKPYQVDLQNKSGETLYGYVGLAITGRSGDITFRGPLVDKYPKEPNKKFEWKFKRQGLSFPASSWDGSDFFVSKDRHYILITQKTKMVLESFKTCLRFEVIENVWDV